jgi:hypothetical protein
VDAVEGEVAVLENTGVAAGAVGDVPGVDDPAIVVNEFDNARRTEVCEEGVAWRDFAVVYASKSEAAAVKGALFHDGVGTMLMCEGCNTDLKTDEVVVIQRNCLNVD